MEDTATVDRLLQLGVSLAVGLIIGLERGWQEREGAEGSRIAGWRTFALIGLAGGVTATIFAGNLVAQAIAQFAVVIFLAAAYRQRSETTQDHGVTTIIAAVLTFGLGELAAQGRMIESAACAVATATVLSAKTQLHAWLRRLSEAELRAGLQFLLISVVVLPILPDRGFGPLSAFNPYRTWLMVVLVAGLSFLGYVMARIWGRRAGLMVTALLGGVVASTAIAFDFSRRAAALSSAPKLLAAGIVAASGISFVRTGVLVLIFQPSWLGTASIPLGAMAAATAIASWLLWRGDSTDAAFLAPRAVQNPLELRPAFQLGIVLAVALILSEWLRQRVGLAGLAGLSAIMGVVEIDATTISLGKMVAEGLAQRTATLMLLLGLATNALLKLAIIWVIGGRRLALNVGLSFLFVAVVAAVAAAAL